MICDRILGSANQNAGDVDWVEIDWWQTVRRAMRLRSASGKEISILLPRDGSLRHRDIIAYADGRPIAICVRPCDLLVLRPGPGKLAMKLGIELGLLHLPCEIVDETLRTPADGPAMEIADRLGIPTETIRDQFHPMRQSVLYTLHDRRP